MFVTHIAVQYIFFLYFSPTDEVLFKIFVFLFLCNRLVLIEMAGEKRILMRLL